MTRYQKMDEITETLMEYCGVGLKHCHETMSAEEFVREVVSCLVFTDSCRPGMLVELSRMAKEDRRELERNMVDYGTAI